MRTIVFLPVELIKAAENENWSRSLAYFIRLKSLYKNNTHYGFTLRSLAERVKCSPACLSAHLKALERKGLVSYQHGNITFAGLKKLQVKYKNRNVGIPVDFKNQYNVLRGQIIRFNLSAQEYNIRKSGIRLRKGGYVPLSKDEKISSCYVGLSAEKIGRLFCLSKASGSRLRSKLADIGILKTRRKFSLLFQNVPEKDFILMKNCYRIPQYSFLMNGSVVVERRSQMEYVG